MLHSLREPTICYCTDALSLYGEYPVWVGYFATSRSLASTLPGKIWCVLHSPWARFHALTREQVVRVLVAAQVIQWREVLVTLVTAVRHLTLMRLGVLKECFELSEGMAALLHHTLVHLEQGRDVWHNAYPHIAFSGTKIIKIQSTA